MKRVALYCREFGAWGKGPAEYARQMALAVEKAPDPRLDIHILVPASALPATSSASVRYEPVPDTARLLQDHWYAAHVMNGLQFDAVWLPKNVTPFGLHTPAVVSFLDLAYYLPGKPVYGHLDTLYMRRMMRRSARKAAHFIAISRHTRSDMVNILSIDEERITVIYPGLSEAYRPVRDDAKLEEVRERYSLPEKFIFYASNLSPRKNVPRLLKAFERIRGRVPHSLVLTGGRANVPIDPAISQYVQRGERVHILGPVPAEDMPAIYTLADVYAHVSLYEGFGFTVLEAQGCEVPVLNSTASCMPEVGGEAALYVDPFDVESIAEGLLRLVEDEPMRARLRENGIANIQRFTWADAARRLQEVLATC